jgi:hypothetical protein
MKPAVRVLFVLIACSIIAPAALAQKRSPRPAPVTNGVYESFKVGAGSGDLEGMRVVLITAHDEQYAIVQIAQGGAEDPVPEFVKATVKGTRVDFEAGSQKYTGTLSAAGLRINGELLKRKPCAEFFK